MKAVIQRCRSARVEVEGEVKGEIGQGLTVFLGVAQGDDEQDCVRLAQKVARLRIFSDPDGRFNLSLQDVGGAALVISNFTLCGDARKGNRPSFMSAAAPDQSKPFVRGVCYTSRSTRRAGGAWCLRRGHAGAGRKRRPRDSPPGELKQPQLRHGRRKPQRKSLHQVARHCQSVVSLYMQKAVVVMPHHFQDQPISGAEKSDLHAVAGDLRGDDGDFQGALEEYKKAVNLDPASPERLVKLAEGYAANDLHHKAFELYQRALEARAEQGGESLTDAYIGLGDLCRTFARSGAAVRSYERAVRSRPKQPFLRWKLAVALVTMGLYERAEAQLRTAVELAPSDAFYHFQLADLYRMMARTGESVKWMTETVNLAPRDEYYRLRLGAALLRDDRPAEAVAHFETAARMVPTNPSYQTLLLYAYMRNQQIPEIAVDVEMIELGAYDEDFVNRIQRLAHPAN